MLAIGGAAAIALGVVQTTDTMAANTDSTTARASQIATQNFFPVLAPINPGYSTPGTCFGGNATLKWQAAAGTPTDQLWQIEEWGDSGTRLMWTSPLLGASTRERQTGLESGGGSTHEYRIYGVNASTNERSTGYVSVYFWKDNGRCGYSKGTAAEGPFNISTWQQTTSYTPADGEVVLNRQTSDRSKFNAPADAKVSESTAPEPPTEATEPSTAESTESSAPSSDPDAPSSSEVPKPPRTEESTPPSTEADKITFGIGLAGDKKALLIYRDGTQICDFPLTEGDTPSINGNTVSVTNGSTVKTVNPKTCTLS